MRPSATNINFHWMKQNHISKARHIIYHIASRFLKALSRPAIFLLTCNAILSLEMLISEESLMCEEDITKRIEDPYTHANFTSLKSRVSIQISRVKFGHELLKLQRVTVHAC